MLRDDVAPLPADAIRAHYEAGGSADYDPLILDEPALVGYWKLDETGGTVAADALGRNPGTFCGGVQLGQATWTPAP